MDQATKRASEPRPKKRRVTKAEKDAFTSQVLYDRVAWKAARLILLDVLRDPLDPELNGRIRRFLERHP